MKNLLTRPRLIVSSVMALSLALAASPAFAVGGYTGVPATDATQAQSDILGFLGTLVSAMAPVLIAVAGGVIGVFLLGWGIRTVFHKVRGAAHF